MRVSLSIHLTLSLLLATACSSGGSSNGGIGGPNDGDPRADAGGGVPFRVCASAVATRGAHTCMLSAEGQLFCWGRNNRGQLGIGTTEDSSRPALVTLPGGAVADSVSTGIAHTCALSNGSVYCWGYNGDQVLGDGTTEDATTPQQVPGITGASVLESGGFHACIIHDGDHLSCWGDNVSGAIGNGLLDTDQAFPVEVAVGVAQVTAGEEHTCIRLAADDSVQCWGRNTEGQLGDGSRENRVLATPAMRSADTPVSGVQDIVAGAFHTCAVKQNQVECWGSNESGQVDPALDGDQLRSIAVGDAGNDAVVAAGERHTCAIDKTGHVRCWGDNSQGQLGQGSTADFSAPIKVAELSNIESINAGDYHTCVSRTGSIDCWGANDNGQLGNGNFEQADNPVPIAVRCEEK